MEDYKPYCRRNASFLKEDTVRMIFEGATLVLALSFIASMFILFAGMDSAAPLPFTGVLK